MDCDVDTSAMQTFKSILEKELHGHHTEIRILLTGKTGEGKSTLINGILQFEKDPMLAVEGAGDKRCTSEINSFHCPEAIPGVSITIFDSPGLQDSTGKEENYIQGMKERCRELNLVLYCLNMTTCRITDDDKHAMKKLKAAFGSDFWKHVVFVLTFANKESVSKKDERDEDTEKEPDYSDNEGWAKLEKERFTHRVYLREKGIKQTLEEKVEIASDIVRGIPFIPTGNYMKDRNCLEPLRLPDREDWLEALLRQCTLRMKDDCKMMKVTLNSKINLAIIINNDNEDMPEVKKRSSEEVQPPPTIVTNEQAEALREKFKALGFRVLYFSNLTVEIIHQLLSVFSKADHSDLASFALVVLSKGKTCHVYDDDNVIVPFDDIFRHFSDGSIAELPKSFFFHFHPSDPKKITSNLPSFISKKSIALFASSQEAGTAISPAVKVYVREIGNCHSTNVKEVFSSMVKAMKAEQPHILVCEFRNTFEEGVILPTCYKPSNASAKVIYLQKQLRLCRSMWYPIRHGAVNAILESKNDVLKVINTVRKIKIGTAATSLAVGGGLTLLGLALIPFTFGGSIAISLVGASVGIGAATAGLTATIVSSVNGNSQLKKAQKYINLDQQLSYNIDTALKEYKEALQMKKDSEALTATQISIGLAGGAGIIVGAAIEGTAVAIGKGAQVIGARVGGIVAERVAEGVAGSGVMGARLVARVAGAGTRAVVGTATETAVEAGAVAGRFAGAGLRAVGGVAALAVIVPLDIYQIVKNSIDLANSDKSGKSEKDVVVQSLVGQAEEMLKGLFHSHDYNGKNFIIEKDAKVMLDGEEDGFLLHVDKGSFVLKSDETCEVSVHTIYAGPFVLPEGATLASAIYDIKVDKKLKKPICIELQHCIDIAVSKVSAEKSMCFAVAESNFSTKQFEFKPVEGGEFLGRQRFGSIEQMKNCLICVLYYKNGCHSQLRNQKELMKYSALCSYSRVSRNYWKIDVSMIKYLGAHETYVQSINGNLHHFPFKFDGSEVTVKKTVFEKGWMITPQEHDKVSRKSIDDLEIHNEAKALQLPSIQLDISVFDEDDAVSTFEYALPLEGIDSSVVVIFNKEI